jgi:hypothetical protein
VLKNLNDFEQILSAFVLPEKQGTEGFHTSIRILTDMYSLSIPASLTSPALTAARPQLRHSESPPLFQHTAKRHDSMMQATSHQSAVADVSSVQAGTFLGCGSPGCCFGWHSFLEDERQC